MELLALALAPGIAIMWFIYSSDKYEKEPLRALLKAFLLGVASTIPALLLQLAADQVLGHYMLPKGWLYFIILAFAVVSISEEGSKFIMVKYYAYRRPFFNEPFDGIVYGVMVSMGFATLENIAYVLQHGMGTAILRMFLSVPAHATFGILMGYYLGLAKFARNNSPGWLKLRGLLLAVTFHGLFDLFLFAQSDSEISSKWPSGILFGSAVLSYLVAARLSWKAIRLHQEISKHNFAPKENGTNIV